MPDWSCWLGRPWVPPFGCFSFVCMVFEAEFGLPHADYSAGIPDTPLAKAIAFRDGLAEFCEQVDAPVEGDLVLFRGAHIGIVVRPGLMLHVNRGHDSRIEPYTSPIWRPRIAGFYRYPPQIAVVSNPGAHEAPFFVREASE